MLFARRGIDPLKDCKIDPIKHSLLQAPVCHCANEVAEISVSQVKTVDDVSNVAASSKRNKGMKRSERKASKNRDNIKDGNGDGCCDTEIVRGPSIARRYAEKLLAQAYAKGRGSDTTTDRQFHPDQSRAEDARFLINEIKIASFRIVSMFI
ncbi:hypothetical protein QAD02_000737 [Eretmocerus hayati]|uniref:Uncharacterized protein n=1 Tax=Eretmocerus hayati TaxID=131215 RepID=A0ACC2NEW4_9HYME|nr:hypothetical protein QAD02_000737 [Eretmocerus hayati]